MVPADFRNEPGQPPGRGDGLMDGFAGALVIDRPEIDVAVPEDGPGGGIGGRVDPVSSAPWAEAPVGTPRQHTLRNAIHCRGIGLHSGRDTTLRLTPGPDESGIVFRRTDLGIDLPARYDFVTDTRLCTLLGVTTPDGRQASVGTVEHVMAALAGAGIDNAVIELDGPEVPILDGSAAPFSFLIACAGRVEQTAPRLTIEVLRTVRVSQGDGPDAAWAELRPTHGRGLSLSMEIAFASRAIGRQSAAMRLSETNFTREVADCRTFTEAAEIERARAAGLARGGSLDNAVVVDADAVLNPGGLRRTDEFVRHKLLDAVGDLALAGRPLRAEFVGHRSGHALNNRLLHALLADPAAWRLVGGARRPRRDGPARIAA